MEEERGKYYSSGPRVRKKGGEREFGPELDMLVTFLARLGGEEGGGERGSWKRREKVSLERAISRAVSALSQEADVASGNDVDGRLSLSSANNIQHRPVYTHPIYLHRGFLPLRARASLVERAWKREPCACAFAAYLCVCVCVCATTVARSCRTRA